MEAKKTVNQIIVDRLIRKIQENKKLPWQRPFLATSINWYSKTEYRGINRILLDGGEYITVNQLKEYNKSKKQDFWFPAGTPSDVVVFFMRKVEEISKSEYTTIKNSNTWKSNKVYMSEGKYYFQSYILRYYTVYDITYMRNSVGEKLESKLGTSIIEVYTPAEDIVGKYTAASGVGVRYDGRGRCYYALSDDCVHMADRNTFKSQESYYRVMFHELVHSTGGDRRLGRTSFKRYVAEREERSREELVAEVGALLLASEAGFRGENWEQDNSDAYILSWVSWLREHENEVVSAMLEAEKAKEYILSGASKKVANENEVESGSDKEI